MTCYNERVTAGVNSLPAACAFIIRSADILYDGQRQELWRLLVLVPWGREAMVMRI